MTKFEMTKFEMTKFEMTKFEMTKFEMTKFEMTKFEIKLIEDTMMEMTKLEIDTRYGGFWTHSLKMISNFGISNFFPITSKSTFFVEKNPLDYVTKWHLGVKKKQFELSNLANR